MPNVKTILGVSNISFGLPIAGREVLNSYYMQKAYEAGLDYAIVNTEKLIHMSDISDKEKELSEALLFNTNDDTVAEFVAFYREKKGVEKKADTSNMTPEEQIANLVVEGSKKDLVPLLDKLLEKYAPLEIINGPLMTGMDEVGRLFNKNDLIVAEVLQSAEVMKASVSHLEQFMEKSDSATKGTVIMATVKGDVHDIGKNLVGIIIGNNGYNVIDLGINTPAEKIREAIITEKADFVGLSGLLVKSAAEMVNTVAVLCDAGIEIPIFVGGAALTEKFTVNKIEPSYENNIVYRYKLDYKGNNNISELNSVLIGEELSKELKLKVGDEIVKYNLDEIKDNVPSTRSPIIINNMEKVEKIEVLSLSKVVKIGEPIMKVTLK